MGSRTTAPTRQRAMLSMWRKVWARPPMQGSNLSSIELSKEVQPTNDQVDIEQKGEDPSGEQSDMAEISFHAIFVRA